MSSPTKRKISHGQTRRRRDFPFQIAILVEHPSSHIHSIPSFRYLCSQNVPQSSITFFSIEPSKYTTQVPSFDIHILHTFFTNYYKEDTYYIVLHESIMGFIEMKAYSYLTIESFHQFLIAGFEMCVRHGVFCWTVETDWKRMTCHPSGLKLNNLLQSDMWACINHKKENELNMIKVKTVSYVKYIPEKHPE